MSETNETVTTRKKGKKIFGIFNLVDIIIILVVLAIVAFAAYKLLGKEVRSEIYMELYTGEVSDFVVEQLKVGDKVLDADRDVVIGTITDFTVSEAECWLADQNGIYNKSTKEDWSSVKIKLKCSTEPYEYGAKIGGVAYTVGHSLTIRAGFAKIYLRVSDIEYIDGAAAVTE